MIFATATNDLLVDMRLDIMGWKYLLLLQTTYVNAVVHCCCCIQFFI